MEMLLFLTAMGKSNKWERGISFEKRNKAGKSVFRLHLSVISKSANCHLLCRFPRIFFNKILAKSVFSFCLWFSFLPLLSLFSHLDQDRGKK